MPETYLITVGGVRVGRIVAVDTLDAVAGFVEGRDIPEGIAVIRAYVVRQVRTKVPRG